MRRVTWALVLVAATVLYSACSTDGVDGDKVANQLPTVWLSAAPPEGSTSKYLVQMNWGGWDPDGEIYRYEYLISDNDTGVFNPADTVGMPWMPVLGNDSTFTFTADQLADTLTNTQVSEFVRSHTFFIRAVDEEGGRSAEPAYRSFTSRTLSPEVTITIPLRVGFNAAEVPAVSTFRWKASDYVDDMLIAQEPESVQWVMKSTVPFGNDFVRTLAYLRTKASKKDWLPWAYYRAPQDTGKFWTTPPTDYGTYVFAIRAKDEAGAVTPVLDELKNVRRVRVMQRSSGPIFTVSNDFLGIVRTASCTTPLTILDLPAGVPLVFSMQAKADSYGGTISGYRYGWDIADLDDPEQWEIDYTPFVGTIARTPSRTYFFGTHTLTMEVIDNSGYCSRVEVKVNIVQFTLERDLLVIDDFPEGTNNGWNDPVGRGVYPSDAEHDAFWLDMVSTVDGFDPVIDVLQTSLYATVPLTTLAQYKSMIWSVYIDIGTRKGYPQLYNFLQYRPKNPETAQSASGKVLPNVVAMAMAAGSHVMICGNQPVQCVVNKTYAGGARYPLIFLYELGGLQGTGPTSSPDINNPVGDLSFAYRELCLETVDYGLTYPNRRRSNTLYCSVATLRPRGLNSEQNDTMREALPLDPNFPSLALRPEAAGPGKWYEPSSRGLDAEVYNPAYFRFGGACQFVPTQPRSCFEPIYGLGCFDTTELTYNQPVAFWTSALADRVGPGSVAARSLVLGFAPVYFNPDDVRPLIEHVLFDEWKLSRVPTAAATGSRAPSRATPQ